MSEELRVVSGQTDEAHPELFNLAAMPKQQTVKKPGQLSDAMIKQFFEDVSLCFCVSLSDCLSATLSLSLSLSLWKINALTFDLECVCLCGGGGGAFQLYGLVQDVKSSVQNDFIKIYERPLCKI